MNIKKGFDIFRKSIWASIIQLAAASITILALFVDAVRNLKLIIYSGSIASSTTTRVPIIFISIGILILFNYDKIFK